MTYLKRITNRKESFRREMQKIFMKRKVEFYKIHNGKIELINKLVCAYCTITQITIPIFHELLDEFRFSDGLI